MKPWQVAFVFAALLAAAAVQAGDGAVVPHELAGFALGAPVSRFEDRLLMNTAWPVRFAESMKEVQARPLPGIRSAVISYGTCVPGGLVNRIKLKYEDSSPGFYDELYGKFTARFGKPGQWRGDPFHVVVAWKWSFKDENGHSLSLILQHNTEDREEKTGNSVKLTDWTLYNQEVDCFKAAHPKTDHGRAPGDPWEIFVPK